MRGQSKPHANPINIRSTPPIESTVKLLIGTATADY